MVDWEDFYRDFRQPDFIPGYEVENHLGGGAFGEVYKARKSSIGKSYAIKFLKLEDEARNEAIERELEQVRLFASIDHPNLVTIEDMGVVRSVPFLIMGYAGEDTLSRHLKRKDLDRESALRTFVQVCRGVLALHDRRLAHFDLKPGNIFLKGEVARVGDYGLAKLLAEGRQTLSFGRGTPQYMAPEMLRNRGDHRADIYSLGVILYESLTFRLPFDSSGYGVIVRETDDPPPFPADFPVNLRTVVERCLRLDPDRRYDSVHEILEAMGQTARQGDSVRFKAAELAGGAGAAVADAPPSPSGEASPSDETPTSSRGEDLRQAASELARGAMGVAIGVWGGVKEKVGGTSPETDDDDVLGEGGEKDEDSKLGAEVVSVSTLGPGAPPVNAPASPPTPPPTPAPNPFGLPPRGAPRWGGSALGGRTSLPTEVQGSTIPVPPPAEGGVMGTISASAVLGAEIMTSLISGPVLVGIRGTGSFIDRVVRGVPGVLGSVIRLVLLMLLLALLGGVVAFVVLFAVSLDT